MNKDDPAQLYRQRREAFVAFHNENPHIWVAFEEAANRMAQQRAHYSHDTIISVIRFRADLKTTGEPFKIANEHKAFYGRWWMMKHGHRNPGFFRLNRMTGEPMEEWSTKYHQTERKEQAA